jgi:TPR repeat protein
LAPPENSVRAASVDTPPASSSARAPITSLEELQKLADYGDPGAEWNLGVRYIDGDGVPHDDSMAVQWFQRAAEQGYVRAQATMGAYYWSGRGVPKDLSKAYFWSALATAQGDETSESRLEGLTSQMTRAEVLAARQQADDWIRQHPRGIKLN